jgi:hypothetical protein
VAGCATEWRAGADVREFLRDSLDNPISALLVSAERSLAAEFPPQAMSREKKRVVAAEPPLSLRPSKERRYRVADPYPRFWLAFVDPHMAEIERMRGDLTLSRIKDAVDEPAWPRDRAPGPGITRAPPSGRAPARRPGDRPRCRSTGQ